MNDANAKQQITDRIKNATNILVTVSTNPSVDELSAALGLTLLLNKFDKHATAVFSGTIPPAITFLDPTKTFENTVDSLRDFIIALDKEKADRLRYRVEDNVVRIFITPYRTRISEEDLEFTHGDFNVELVLALGVENKEVLDQAIAAHGRILHDATVATINAQNKTSNLGSIGWQDPNASRLGEMLVALGESLKPGLLDEQIATALLTGIVAATNRFSNKQTSPKSMTMAAQLMAAGANQQLIAAKLEETSAISPENKLEDGSTQLTEGSSKKVRQKPLTSEAEAKEVTEAKKDDLGEMTISHSDEASPNLPPETAPNNKPTPSTIEEHDERNKQVAGEEALSAALAKLGTAKGTNGAALLGELKQADSPSEDSSKSWRNQALTEPSMGGELNATTKEAEAIKREEEQSRLNKVIMDHGPAPPKGKTIMPPTSHNEAAPVTNKTPAGTLADIESTLNRQPSSPPEVAPITTPISQPAQPVFSPPTPGALPPPPPLPEFPDFSSLPPLPPSGPPTAPPLDANGLPIAKPISPPVTPSSAPAPTEPGQFKIPGQ